MAKIGVFHAGTQHSWQTARALDSVGDLAWYATQIYWREDKFPYNALPYLPTGLRKGVEAELRRFRHPDLDPRKVHPTLGIEWLMRIATRVGSRKLVELLQPHTQDSMLGPVRRLMAKQPVRAVWGYDTQTTGIFRHARKRGVGCILDRTIGHPVVFNAIMEDVYDRYPEFFLPGDFRAPAEVIDRVDTEHELADAILCGSEFCASTLADPCVRSVDPSKVKVLHYCYDDVFFRGGHVRRRTPGQPVRFLFTGQAGPRKGFHLVLKVFDRIPKSAATLTVIGHLQVPRDVFARYADRIEYHPTVPRPDVLGFMEKADYLVFPSYFEGAALVVNEAMAVGLGVIQSRHTLVPQPDSELVMNEVTEEELYRCVMTAIEKPELLETLSADGLERSAGFTFDAYRSRVAGLASTF